MSNEELTKLFDDIHKDHPEVKNIEIVDTASGASMTLMDPREYSDVFNLFDDLFGEVF